MNKLVSTIALLVTASFLLACSPSPHRETLSLKGQEPTIEWESVKKGTAKLKLKTLVTGSVTVPVSGMLNLDDPKTDPLQKGSMEVEVFAHWIRHPVKGDFLIDTGLDARFRNTKRGSLKGLIAPWIVEDSQQQAGQDILSQLKQNQVDLKGVFLTHVHGDHSSGIPVLPVGIDITLGKNESLHQYPFIMYNDHFDTVTHLHELDFSLGSNMAPLGKVLDIFGDGSLWAISTPGHTTGHVSYLLNTEEGWVLLTGDASHTRWGFENGVAPGWSENEGDAEKSLAMLRTFSRENSNVRVIFGHQF